MQINKTNNLYIITFRLIVEKNIKTNVVQTDYCM